MRIGEYAWLRDDRSRWETLRRLPAAGWRRVRRLADFLTWVSRGGREAAKRWGELSDLHSGEQCVVLGNGPSLNAIDPELLRGEVTFGLNRIYLKFSAWGFATSYLVAVNDLVIRQFAAELLQAPCPLFISWKHRDKVPPVRRDVRFLFEKFRPHFSEDPSRGVWSGGTVTFVALQIAYYMGFRRVILVGVDHRFSDSGTPNRAVVSESADQNHFDPRYFGPGIKWQLPDLSKSEYAYKLARQGFERDGREVVDATVNGALRVFPKLDLRDALRGGPEPAL